MENNPISRLNAAERAERNRLNRYSVWLLLFFLTLAGLLIYTVIRAAAQLGAGSFPAEPARIALPLVQGLLLLAALVLLLTRRYAFRLFFFAYAVIGALAFFGAVFFDLGDADYVPFLALLWLPYLYNADRVRVICGLAPSGEVHAPHGDEPAATVATEFSEGAQPDAVDSAEVSEVSGNGGDEISEGGGDAGL